MITVKSMVLLYLGCGVAYLIGKFVEWCGNPKSPFDYGEE